MLLYGYLLVVELFTLLLWCFSNRLIDDVMLRPYHNVLHNDLAGEWRCFSILLTFILV